MSQLLEFQEALIPIEEEAKVLRRFGVMHSFNIKTSSSSRGTDSASQIFHLEIQSSSHSLSQRVLKRYRVDKQKHAIHELRILLALQRLRRESLCPHFVYLQKWALTRPLDDDDLFMFYLLEHGGAPLAHYRKIAPLDFKMILFQIIYALSVAQAQFHFVHNDLHLKNVLLLKSDDDDDDDNAIGYYAYRDESNTWYTHGVCARIIDFANTRLLSSSSSHLICRDIRHPDSVYDARTDLQRFYNDFRKHQDRTELSTIDAYLLRHLGLSIMSPSRTTDCRQLLHHPYFFSLQTPCDNSARTYYWAGLESGMIYSSSSVDNISSNEEEAKLACSQWQKTNEIYRQEPLIAQIKRESF